MAYYPSYVYNINENITRNNMKEYDKKCDEAYKAIKEKEKQIGRKLNCKERYEISKQYGV